MGTVYFAKCGRLVKIGYTADVEARIAQLQTGNPLGLALIAALPGALPSVERHYHRAFADQRVRGEWFSCCGDLATVIKFIQDGARPLTPTAIEYYRPLPKPRKIKNPRQAEIGRIHGELRVRMHGEKYAALRAEFVAKGGDHADAVAAMERRRPELTR